MIEPTKQQAQKWANALRSGRYKQCYHKLETKLGYNCCLGVGCREFIPEDDLLLSLHGVLTEGLPSEQSKCPKWLRQVNEDFRSKTGFLFISIE